MIALESDYLPALRLDHALSVDAGLVFVALGIEFLQLVNGTVLALNDASSKAMAIVKVGRREEVLAPTTLKDARPPGLDSDLVRPVEAKNFSLLLREYMPAIPGRALSGNPMEGIHSQMENMNPAPVVLQPP